MYALLLGWEGSGPCDSRYSIYALHGCWKCLWILGIRYNDLQPIFIPQQLICLVLAPGHCSHFVASLQRIHHTSCHILVRSTALKPCKSL